MLCELDKSEADLGGGGGDQEVPYQNGVQLGGDGDNPPPCSSSKVPQGPQEYATSKIQKTELDHSQNLLNCYINCLKFADKEIFLTAQQFRKIKEKFLTSSTGRILTSGHPPPQSEEDFKSSDEYCGGFNVPIKNLDSGAAATGAIIENLTQTHFKKKLEQLSTIFGDTLQKASDKITTLQAELRQSQEVASQVVTIWMASKQSPQNEESPPPPPPPPSAYQSNPNDDGHSGQPGPSNSTSDLQEDTIDPDILTDSSEHQLSSTLINLHIQNPSEGSPISVPAYLSSSSPPIPSSSPPISSEPLHAWKILNRPLPTNFFECLCHFKCLTFTGLLNHFRKLKITVKCGGGVGGSSSSPPPPLPPPPPIIIVEDEAEEFERSPPPSPIPSTPPPTQSSPTSNLIANYFLNATPKFQDKKKYMRDPSRILYPCTAVTPLPNGNLCSKQFTSLMNMRRHKLKLHPLEEHLPEWGCGDCGKVFKDEGQRNQHQLIEHDLAKKRSDGREPCSLCEKVGVKSDKCELMHKPVRRGRGRKRKCGGGGGGGGDRRSAVVVDLVEKFVEGMRAKKRCKVMMGNKKFEGADGDMQDGMVKKKCGNEQAVYINFDGD